MLSKAVGTTKVKVNVCRLCNREVYWFSGEYTRQDGITLARWPALWRADEDDSAYCFTDGTIHTAPGEIVKTFCWPTPCPDNDICRGHGVPDDTVNFDAVKIDE